MKYTLIVPHYNEPGRLKRLLSSLPSRADLQVFVVDDCSPDQTGLDSVRQAFLNVEFFSTSNNQGAGAARNVGLQHAGGKFVLFADADDEFHSGAFEVFDQTTEGHHADIYYFLADAVVESTDEHSIRADALNALVRSEHDIHRTQY